MSDLLKMTPTEFCNATGACSDGRQFALTQPTMADVWDNCPKPDWLLWIADQLGQGPNDRTLRLFAVWCARNTPLPDGKTTSNLPTDSRSIIALDAAERFVNGQATHGELAAAWDAAWAAAWVAAWDAARDAAWDAASAAAWDAASAAAWVAAWAAARDAAWDAASAAAWDAASAVQAAHFRTLVPNPFRKEAQPSRTDHIGDINDMTDRKKETHT